MADARAKQVLSALADIASNTNYMVDKVTQLAEPLGAGDTIEVPSLTAFTVTQYAGSDVSANSATPNILTCLADREPFLPVSLPQMSALQLMNGNWAPEVAKQALIQIKNDIDSKLTDYLAKTLNYSSTAAYTDNVASDSLAVADFANAQGGILANQGSAFERLAVFLHPYAYASMVSVSGWQPNTGDITGNLGIPMVGSVLGMPVYISQAIPRLRTVASTAYSNVSNVQTITVASGHGIVPGMKVTFNTITAGGDVSTAVAVSSVTSTTVVIANAGGNSSATEAGTITIEGCENLVMDTGHIYAAQQKLPGMRIVPQPLQPVDILQVHAVWGRIGRAGYCRTLMSPPSSA